MGATIKTEKHIVQDTDMYLDVDCDAGYDNDDRIWRRRVFLDKETNGVVTSDEIFFSESGDSGFEETDAVPADIEEALEACVDSAVGGTLKPKADLAEALSVLEEFLVDAETMKEPYRNEAVCERARAALGIPPPKPPDPLFPLSEIVKVLTSWAPEDSESLNHKEEALQRTLRRLVDTFRHLARCRNR